MYECAGIKSKIEVVGLRLNWLLGSSTGSRSVANSCSVYFLQVPKRICFQGCFLPCKLHYLTCILQAEATVSKSSR